MNIQISENQDYVYVEGDDGSVRGVPVTSENVEEVSRLLAERGF